MHSTDSANWAVACLVASGRLLAGAVIVSRAVRRLGVLALPPLPPERDATGTAELEVAPPEPETSCELEAFAKRKTTRQLGRELLIRIGLFGAVQVVLFLVDLAWAYDLVATGTVGVLMGRAPDHAGVGRGDLRINQDLGARPRRRHAVDRHQGVGDRAMALISRHRTGRCAPSSVEWFSSRIRVGAVRRAAAKSST